MFSNNRPPPTTKGPTPIHCAFISAGSYNKGQSLLRLMLASDEEAGQLLRRANRSVQSEHLDQNAFQQNGWARYLDDYYYNDDAFDRLTRLLELDKSTSVHIGHHHMGSDTLQQKRTTHAHFDNVICAPLGIIVAVNSRSPTSNVQTGMADMWRDWTHRDRLPDLRYWSDVAYLQWTSVTDGSSNLRHVVRLDITNEPTKAVITHLMRLRSSVENQYPMFPGVSWSVNEEEALALLGTPVGNGVGCLLIQHKAQLGHKVVEKVTLVYKDWKDADDTKVPTLIFEFRDVRAGEKWQGKVTVVKKLRRKSI